MGNTVKRVPVFDILSTLCRVCFAILYSSIGTKRGKVNCEPRVCEFASCMIV